MVKLSSITSIALILFAACHAEGKRSRKSKRNITDGPNPRTFLGIPVHVNTILSVAPTEPQTSISSSSSVQLELRSNHTSHYLTGALSTTVLPVVYILAMAVGIPANVGILLAIGTKVRLISSAILYSSLAASDLLLLSSLVLKTHYHLHGNHWVFGELACRLTTACFYGNLYCSAFTLACISLKRYVAVVHPFLYKTLPKRSASAWSCLAVWLVFFSALLPELLRQQSYPIRHLHITTCHDVQPQHQPWMLYYSLGLAVLGFLLPLVVTVLCYASIAWHLTRGHSDWAVYIRASSFNLLVFLLCFAPACCCHALHYLLLWAEQTDGVYACFSVAVSLCCVHSALDPFLFALMSRTVSTRPYILTRKECLHSVSA